jgi:hypothetical protein
MIERKVIYLLLVGVQIIFVFRSIVASPVEAILSIKFIFQGEGEGEGFLFIFTLTLKP